MTTTLIQQLAEQTAVHSSPTMMARTSAYRALLARGEAALPELYDALRDRVAVVPVIKLLREITNLEVDAPRGDVKALVDAWLKTEAR